MGAHLSNLAARAIGIESPAPPCPEPCSGDIVAGAGAGAGVAYRGDAGAAGNCHADCLDAGPGTMCFEPDPYSVTKQAQWKYFGAGEGSYDSVQQVTYVGQGAGSWERQEVVSHTGYRWRPLCITLITCVLLVAACIIVIPLLMPAQRDTGFDIPAAQDCSLGAHDWKNLWDETKQNYCCQTQSVGCPSAVATPVKIVHFTHYVTRVHRVPHPVADYVEVPVPHVEVRHVYREERPYECDEGLEDVKKWDTKHKRYCCFLRKIACPTKVVKHDKYITVMKPKLIPKYIPMKATENKTVVVPQYYPKEIEPKPIKVSVEQPPKIIYQPVNETRYIRVPVPGKPRIVVQEKPVPVEMPPEVVKVYDHIKVHPFEVKEPPVHHHHFDCNAGYSNWYFGWSPKKKTWCCEDSNRGCPGTWHGSAHLHIHTHVGQATGHIYDCDAGFSNWLHGWSDSKKSWCCDKFHVGCAPHSCSGTDVGMKGCARTTLSPLKCDAVCTHAGESVSCMERIHWTKQNVFQGRGNACALAYSKVQVECSICRGCSIEEAGCTVNVATSAAFDCNAALSNFFRAWSPSKKQWCCTQEGKGCEGNSPPHVDPGFGMVWKHVQVHGYWTWQAVGGGHVKLPYDCHAGLANFQIGWSSGKRAWCCSKQHLGCGAVGGAASAAGAAGGFAAGAAGATGGEFVHHTTVVMDHAAHGNPPAMAARGMMWHWAHSGGHWHWVQIHAGGHLPFDCEAGFAKWQTGWSGSKKQWCCQNMGKGCQ